MRELLYFDANAGYGPRPKKHKEARWTKQHLLEDLDLAGIAGALVTHSQALHYDPMLGNLRLVEEIANDRDRLFPCWVAIPPTSGEFPEVEAFMEQLGRHDVRAVRIEPVLFGLPPREEVWGPLRDGLLRAGSLVVTSINTFSTDLAAIEAILDVFHENHVLLINHGWHQWRYVAYWMTRHPRLQIDFSTFQANLAVEHFAGRFGAERCIFGTGLPEKAPGAARGFLDWTFLPRAEAELVAGGNLMRLLGGRGPQRVPAPITWHDEITAAARAGEPLPNLVMDAHCHVLHDGAQTAGTHLVMLDGDADGMIRLRQRVGIDRTAVMSWTGPLCADTGFGNRIVEEAVRRYPDHFIGLATINPEHDSEDEIDAIIRRYHGELGFPGLKTLSSRHNLRYDAPEFDRWFLYADEHRLYAVVDTAGAMNDEEIGNLASKFPNMGIHLDHCGRSWEYAKWAVSLMRRFPNIWAQLNFTAVTNGTIEFIAEHVGADRVLFGTDSPMRDPRPQAAWLAFTRLPEQDKRRIYGENFARILAGVKLPEAR